jgi:uncharacterized membrane protein
VIYGLAAALGWGLADFGAAVVGRRIGSLATVLVSQATWTLAMTILLLAGGFRAGSLAPLIGIVVINGLASAAAYITHYRGLELGPVAVVSPIGAAYALVGAFLAVVLLDERPGFLTLVGGFVVVAGVMLTSTDLVKLREGTHTRPPGLWWAIASAVLFGIGAFLLGFLAKEAGWVAGLWGSRVAQLMAFLAVALLTRDRLGGAGRNRATGLAVLVGLADLLGVVAYSIGAESGFLSVVLIASAVFPLVAVALSVWRLHERPVPNQYVGIALTVGGLLMLGLG